MIIMQSAETAAGVMGGIAIVFGLVSLVFFVLWVIALIDVFKYPGDAYERAGKNQILSLVLIILLGIIGVAYHWFAVRPAVRQAAGV